MILFKQPEQTHIWDGSEKSLEYWLLIATRELTDSAGERIGLEIGAHFAEAVEEFRAKGLTENSAQAAALTELGDPQVAAKHFRKEHLTRKEALGIESYLSQAKSLHRLLLWYFLFVASLLTSGLQLHGLAFALVESIQFIALVIIPTSNFAFARRRNFKTNVGMNLLLHDSCFSVFLICSAYSWDGLHGGFWLIFVLSVSSFIFPFGLRSKLRRIDAKQFDSAG